MPIELTPVNPPTHLLDERQEISERDAWTLKPGGKYFFTRNMSAVCAFAVGGAYVPGAGFVCVGAHTDSPCPKLKPNTKSTAERFLQVRTQNYGGGLWYTWFDRDLGVAGRVVVKKKDGTVTHELLKINRPVMRIPSLAIHLNREMNNGFAVNFQQHMAPIIADATESALGAGSVPKDEPDPKKLKESSDKDTTSPQRSSQNWVFENQTNGHLGGQANFRACVSMRASGGPSTSSDLAPHSQQLSKMAPEPAKEAVDAVAYFNEAWTPYHAVLATCRRLIDAGYEVRARAPSPSSLE